MRRRGREGEDKVREIVQEGDAGRRRVGEEEKNAVIEGLFTMYQSGPTIHSQVVLGLNPNFSTHSLVIPYGPDLPVLFFLSCPNIQC